ncbi:PAS domain S-box protein [Solitalea lacus]|uniref:PAS domain S-box protein n=1 Tax=Solitalea lacus TaxID=2911172 RepID=UPI001EDA6949|nr:PAS domain S-box protein [Solitalea lacus]UKJ08118.1 PAS domain S-box protein [Solitalea lacus]
MKNKLKSIWSNLDRPEQFIWITLFVCVLPSILNLVGINFGVNYQTFDTARLNTLNYESQLNLIYQWLEGRFIHIILVSMAIAIAFLTVILAFVDYSIKRDITTPIVGVALLCAGLFDVFHILSSTQLLSITTELVDISSFTWLLSSGYHAFILIIGTGMFLIMRPVGKTINNDSNDRFVTYISIIFVLLTFLTINILLNLKRIPTSALTGKFYTHPIDGVPLLLYFIALVFVFPKFYQRYPSKFSLTLVLSVIPAIFTQLHMAFSSQIFDNHFMIAHFMKMITYIMPFCGLGLNYLETLRNEKLMVANLHQVIDERKKAEELVSGVLNSSTYAIITFESIRNNNGQIVDFKAILTNPVAENMLRGFYKLPYHGAIINRSLSEIFYSVKESGLVNEFIKVVEFDTLFESQHYSTNLQRWFYINAVKYRDGCVVVFDDITEIKRNEIELKESKNFVEKIADNTPTGILVVDIENLKPIYSNKELLQIIEINEEELFAADELIINAILNGEPQNLTEDYLSKLNVIAKGQIIENEHKYKTESGEWKWLYSKQVPFKTNLQGKTTQALCVIQDITERKISQAKILKSEEKYRNLFEQSKDMIFIINREGNIIDINQSAVNLLETELDKLKSSNLRSFFFTKSDWKNFLHQIIQRGNVIDMEITLVSSKGQRIYALITAAAQYDNEGRSIFFQGIIHDITALKRSEHERLVSQKLDATERVARTIAHEVRNPLTNVNLALEQLKLEINDKNDSYDFYFDIIQRNCKRINVLITQLLNSTRAEYLELKNKSVNELIDETLELAIDRIKLNEIKVEKDFMQADCEISIDEDKMKIALLNIIINAIEAMTPQKGLLTLKTYCHNGKAIIEIADNGSGIKPENISKLFEPFYTEKQNGSGLGLTSTQNIVLTHEGTIDVESHLGIGTRFILKFNHV